VSLIEFKVGASGVQNVPFSVLRADDTADPALMPDIPESDLRALYRTMVLTRAFDARMFTLQRQGRLGFYLACTGEEAATVGSAYALKPEDWVFPCYREQGCYLWRGVTVQEMAHQCYGNALDHTKGRQMPVHYSFRAQNIVSISSPLAVQLPQAVGTAWAAKLRHDPIVTLTYFGEGSTSEGDFHVGLNFAGVYKTPTIFFLRNNGWAISTPREVQTASENFAMKAAAYGFEGVLVDGNDILAVIAATQDAVPHRGRHLPGRLALDLGRPLGLPQRGRREGLGGEGPRPALPALSRQARDLDPGVGGRAAGRGQGRGRRGGAERRKGCRSHPRDPVRRRVRRDAGVPARAARRVAG